MSIKTNCRRKMVILRNTNSPIFEEAYLILRDDKDDEESVDLLDEANKLLNSRTFRVCEKKRSASAIWFFVGCALTLAVLLPICLIFLK